MYLKRARATKFRSIDDSGWVDVSDVLAFVGKNESGKTTFLTALEKLNSADVSRGSFNPVKDYPRREYAKYKKQHETNPATAIQGEFELTPAEITKLEKIFGSGCLKQNTVGLSKNYNNDRNVVIHLNEPSVIKFLVSSAGLSSELSKSLIKKNTTIPDLIADLEAQPEKPQQAVSFLAKLKTDYPKGLWDKMVNGYLMKMVPKFAYFDDYSIMDGTINIQALKQKAANPALLNDSDKTFLSLVAMADTNVDDLQNNQSYEALKAQLEAVSASITDDVFEYWSQNKQLRVEFDIMQANGTETAPFNSGTNLYVRIWNDRHRVSVPFDERSRGFVWFFSFFAYFSQLEGASGSLILLLDEPGLNLHAAAQADFLRFIDERLSPDYQVLYTTHSPFMVSPGKLERVRTVQDIDGQGTTISKDIMKNDQDTIFPLQAALGYDLAQTLFIGPNNLLVEGPSDLIYLQLLGRKAELDNKQGLDPAWVVVPAGGADKVSTFVSLLGGNRLNIAVLMDVAAKDRQRIESLQANQLLGRSALVQVNEATGKADSDIEDIFAPEFYLELVNGAYKGKLKSPLTLKDLPVGNQRIVKKIEELFKNANIEGLRFSHYLPAEYLLREQTTLVAKIDADTVERAVKLFSRINGLLENQPGLKSKENVTKLRTLEIPSPVEANP